MSEINPNALSVEKETNEINHGGGGENPIKQRSWNDKIQICLRASHATGSLRRAIAPREFHWQLYFRDKVVLDLESSMPEKRNVFRYLSALRTGSSTRNS